MDGIQLSAWFYKCMLAVMVFMFAVTGGCTPGGGAGKQESNLQEQQVQSEGQSLEYDPDDQGDQDESTSLEYDPDDDENEAFADDSLFPTEAPTPVPTFTPDNSKPGSVELVIDRYLGATASNDGEVNHRVEGTVPLTIKYTKKEGEEKGTWEVTGKGQGAGTTTFKSSRGTCYSTWWVNFAVSGNLIRMGELTSQPEAGCYIQIYFNEVWESQDVSCQLAEGSAFVTSEPEEMGFGPVRLVLENGAKAQEKEDYGVTWWDYTWKLQKLNLPGEHVCMFGGILPKAE